MKPGLAAAALILCLTAASGCAAGSQTPAAPPAESAAVSAASQPGEEAHSPLEENYADAAALSVSDSGFAPQVSCQDRLLLTEDPPANGLEETVYRFYLYNVTSRFDEQQALTGPEESFALAVRNEQTAWESGRYIQEYRIHDLSTLTAQEVEKASGFAKEDLLEQIDRFGWEEYAIVRVDLSWKYNEAALLAGPQLGDGRYQRYYLLARTSETEPFCICQVYWEDFLPA